MSESKQFAKGLNMIFFFDIFASRLLIVRQDLRFLGTCPIQPPRRNAPLRFDYVDQTTFQEETG